MSRCSLSRSARQGVIPLFKSFFLGGHLVCPVELKGKRCGVRLSAVHGSKGQRFLPCDQMIIHPSGSSEGTIYDLWLGTAIDVAIQRANLPWSPDALSYGVVPRGSSKLPLTSSSLPSSSGYKSLFSFFTFVFGDIMLANGSHFASRLHYILAVTFIVAILLLVYETTPRRSVTLPGHEDFNLLSLECRARNSEVVMRIKEKMANKTLDDPHLSSPHKDIVTSPLGFYPNPFAPTSDPSKRAYATTLYDEGYLPGALLLGYSLRKHGMLRPDIAQHMILLHISGRLSEDILQLLRSVGWETVAVERVPAPEGKPPGPEYIDQYTKLRLFELDQFDQVFYIDADALVVKSFPEIWSFPAPFAACRDIRIGTDSIWLPTINAGTLLLKPNRYLFAHMLEAAPFMKYENWFAEQGLLNEYWLRDATFYPYIFNGQ
ncbi:hypothetical protein FRC15_011373, partial [Serendipita sp. 397]